MSMAHKSTDKKFGEIVKSKQENKGKFDLLGKLFHATKGKKFSIANKIDKFADKKASHFVNLKKLKKKEPFSTDLNDNMQVRALSRTFTGGFEMMRPHNMLKFSESLNNAASTPSGLFKKHSTPVKQDLIDDFPHADIVKPEDSDGNDIINQSQT